MLAVRGGEDTVSTRTTYESMTSDSAGKARKGRDPIVLRILEWSVATLAISGLLALLLSDAAWRRTPLHEALIWIVIVAALDLLPVRLWHGLVLVLSLPVLLAAAFLYPVGVAAGIAFVGSIDARELRHEISVAHALFNRSQVALSTASASIVFHSLHTELISWPYVLFVAMLAVAADLVVNWTLIFTALRTKEAVSVGSFLANMSGNDPVAFVSTYACFGLVAVLLAITVDVGGNWGLVAVGIPVLLAREVFVRSSQLRDAALLLAEKSRMLLAITEKIADERRDERLAIAAGLHDDLLPPLYKVHLLGQVVRQDLATGQLLALDDDVPDLVSATEHAGDTARSLIRRLRQSPLGTDGLGGTLHLLIRSLSAGEAAPRIHTDLTPVGGPPVVQLLAYQVAREALRNAIKYSSARNIWIRLKRDGRELRLTVEDDGVGFEPTLVNEESHFGLQLMRERVQLVGGVFWLDASPGSGTRIIVRLPGELER
jgi:signal transduction histidine kinase